MTAAIIRADARILPFPDASVDLVVTSPPYWGLRSYQDGGTHYDGQIGAEPTWGEYVAALLDCTREWMRVLKPEGSLWVNLGDKYAAAAPGRLGTTGSKTSYARSGYRDTTTAGRPKSLLGLPWRYALGCIDQLSLILRAEVIWSKPNGLPESVKDRVRRSHEQWFHLVKQPRYYSTVDHIREPYADRTLEQARADTHAGLTSGTTGRKNRANITGRNRSGTTLGLGALPRSVWDIPTQPLRVPEHLNVDHFAAFPPALIRPIILGWSPLAICTICGEGRRPVVDKPGLLGGDNNPDSRNGSRRRSTIDGGTAEWQARVAQPDRITSHACACVTPTAPTRPAIVLDPFGGTGTTALVADVHGRHGISADMSADYCRLAQWRTTDPAERARALGVPKPPHIPNEQLELL
ncbi:DNA-methyltransferase [Actinomadura rubrisoli]|uniref:DNA-methyltransferase n=1 Tax=Actinomadura rubrisoli TaxID=2530368 RepID=UPI0014052D4D|nr:site-specific DNA-methyltransferase [Actinomadura rubrisoli]